MNNIFSELKNNIINIKKCRHGLMVYPKNDKYIGRALDKYGEFSEFESMVFRQIVRPGMIVVEAGANIGAHTLMLARSVGEKGFVFAFEPQRILSQILSANLILNELTRTKVIQAGLGAKKSKLIMPVLDYSEERNYGGIAMDMADVGEEVEVMTIDEMELPGLHFIKIDVEGMEKEVLAGACNTIKKYKPVIYLENDRKERSAELIACLQNLDYRLWWHLPPYFNKENYFQEQQNIFGHMLSVNMICVHKDYDESLSGFVEVKHFDEYPETISLSSLP